MPTYEYECKSCGHLFEIFQTMSEAPLRDCPQCGKEIRRLINGGSGVIFRGSGFYVTDKKGAAGADASKPKPAPSGKESAPKEACAACPASSSCSENKAAG
jgi:putative FmdB family regulatory protein